MIAPASQAALCPLSIWFRDHNKKGYSIFVFKRTCCSVHIVNPTASRPYTVPYTVPGLSSRSGFNLETHTSDTLPLKMVKHQFKWLLGVLICGTPENRPHSGLATKCNGPAQWTTLYQRLAKPHTDRKRKETVKCF